MHIIDIKLLRWFSNNYFNVLQRGPDTLQFNDLRFGSIRGDGFEKHNDYVFRFILTENPDGTLKAEQTRDRPNADGAFEALLGRINGKLPNWK